MATDASLVLISRDRCIACGSAGLSELSGATFGDPPVRSFIESDPWGENPMPVLESERWSFVQCDECGQRFHGRILSKEWNEIRFSRWMSEDAIRQFEAQHASGGTSAVAHVQHVLRLRDLGVRRVLDFGCGFGQFLEMCRSFGIDAVGVDRSHARRSGAGLEIFAELDDAPGQFDAVTLFEVLEHLDDPLAMIRLLRTRLNPRGVMIVEVPNTTGTVAISSREDYYKIHPLDHINAFTPSTLARMMDRAGFAPINKRSAFVTTSLKRVAKDFAKARLKQNSTQRYFRMKP